jgi:methionyl-tRNA formyltransferase
VFVTGHQFGVAALRGLIKASSCVAPSLSIPLVVTLPVRHRKDVVGFDDVSLARQHGIESVPASDERLASDRSLIEAFSPHFLIIVGWSRLITGEVLDIPARLHQHCRRHGLRHGAIGMHPSLLPQGRGRAPIPWTILNALRTTGLSVFCLEESADSGEIVQQLPLVVAPNETATSLFRRFTALHEVAGFDLGLRMAAGCVTSYPQDESSATYWAARRLEDSRLDFALDSRQVLALVRAQADPYPRAFVDCRSGRLYVNSAEAVVLPDLAPETPGIVIDVGRLGEPIVACSQGFLRITSWTLTSGWSPAWRRGQSLAQH